MKGGREGQNLGSVEQENEDVPMYSGQCGSGSKGSVGLRVQVG